jgi:predicted DNA-binding protein
MSTITVRVPPKIKQKLKKYNVNVSKTVRKALDNCVEELERKDLEQKLEQLKNGAGKKIDPQAFANLIREERENH